MIPQSAIHIDGGRAWLVVSSPVDAEVALDRPCDSPDCRGGEVQYPEWEGHTERCPDCDGTGRHTFEIEVEAGYAVMAVRDVMHGEVVAKAARTLRVHVVPGMVLPIVHDASEVAEVDAGFIWNPGPRWYERYQMGEPVERVTLPPDARPGMWAVQLEVHEQHH